MDKKKYFKKTFFYLGQVVIFLMFLEIFLRLGGWLFIVYRDLQNLSLHSLQNTYVIECLGESITADGGQKSYPRLLERVLNARQKVIHFHVLNRGIPSMTTTELSSSLENEVAVLKPDMVVLMLGSNDRLFYSILPNSRMDTFKYLVLDRSKVYRLLKSLTKEVLKSVKNHFRTLDDSNVKSQQGPTPSFLENGKQEYVPDGGLGFMKYMHGENWTGPTPIPGYFKEIIKYHPLTIRNFRDMVDILIRQRIKVVIMQYPMLPMDPLKRQIAMGNDLMYVDNEFLFKNAVHQKGLEYFFEDDWGHLTENGSWLLAEHLADEILKNVKR